MYCDKGFRRPCNMKEVYRMYNRMMETFVEHTNENDFYDLDMFCDDLCKNLFVCTDPQDINTGDYLVFQQALLLLARDDMMLHYFGLAGLSVIYGDMLDYGERYYILKTWIR